MRSLDLTLRPINLNKEHTKKNYHDEIMKLWT